VIWLGTSGDRVALSPDGKTLAIDTWTGVIWIMDLTADGPKRRHILGTEVRDGKPNVTDGMAFSPDGKMLAAGDRNQTVHLWDLTTGKEVRPPAGHVGAVLTVDFSPNNTRILSAGADGKARFWDPISARQLAECAGHGGCYLSQTAAQETRAIAFVPRSGATIVGEDGKAVQEIYGSAHCLAVGSDPRHIVLGRDDGAIRWVDLTAAEQEKLLATEPALQSLALSPNGRLVAAGFGTGKGDGWLKVWDVTTGKERFKSGDITAVRRPAFSPDGNFLATALNSGSVKLWDMAGNERATLVGDNHGVATVAFSPDARLLAGACFGGSVVIWDMLSKQEIHRWQIPDVVYGLGFANDGRHLALGNALGTIYILRLAEAPPRAPGAAGAAGR